MKKVKIFTISHIILLSVIFLIDLINHIFWSWFFNSPAVIADVFLYSQKAFVFIIFPVLFLGELSIRIIYGKNLVNFKPVNLLLLLADFPIGFYTLMLWAANF